MEEVSLYDRISEFRNSCSFRLMVGIPFISSISLIKKTNKEISETDINLAAQKAAKTCRASCILFSNNKIDLIVPPTSRWSDMTGEGYVSRIASIIGAAIGSIIQTAEPVVDLWSVPNEKEVYKFIKLRVSESNPVMFRKTDVFAPLPDEEIDKLPAKHIARTNKNVPIQRIVYKKQEIDLSGPIDYLSTIKEIFDENKKQMIIISEPSENG